MIYFFLFFKATIFSSGGFSNLPSLHQDLTARAWAPEADFGESLSIGQVTPGPNGLWVIVLGYLSYGFLGALLALIAITIPPFFVLLIAAIYTRLEHQRWIPGLMRGISLAVVGTFLTVFWTISKPSSGDWHSWLICLVAFGMAFSRRINILIILIIAAIAGFLLYR
ncbi:chromate transporter [Dictyobacter arantiisoli]|uniref:Chromate transporter n=2 Tax=Dictyobacter arantiisoli TaxID=2014874 RepID=A0A5A5TDZ2_9CHLR|nr:chromate transporter [Dictyobacter arantiisoli]